MACGRPIVAALDGEGARVIKESGAGLVSPAEDTEGLANIILAMYRMPRLDREAMGRQGREYCESNFQREVLIDRLESWIQEMITSDR
jgi:glycosyltransferase involved in cell wall biosynthesis